MKIKESSILRDFSLIDVFALYCIIWAVSPIIQYGTIFRLLAVTCAVFWMVGAAYKAEIKKQSYTMIILIVAIYFIGIILISVLTGTSIISAIIQKLHMMIFMLILCMGIYYSENKPEFLVAAMKLAIALLTIFCLITFFEYQFTPNISRIIVYSEDIARSYAQRGVGGYGLIYASVGCMPAIIYNILTGKDKSKYLYLIPAIIMSITIFSSAYLIATILLILEFVFFIFRLYKGATFTSTFIILSVIFLLMYAFVYGWLINNTHVITNIFEGTPYQIKAAEIVDYLKNDEMSGHLGGRVERYGRSFKAIWKHLLFGAQITDNMEDIGGHSTLLDVLGTYGIFFSWGYYVVFIYVIRKFINIAPNKGFAVLMTLIIILNGILDTYTGEMGVAYFIVFPAVICITKGEDKLIT